MPELHITMSEERTATIKIGAPSVAIEQFGKFLAHCGQEGYTFKTITTHEVGQRDPVVTGLSVTLRREGR